MPASKHWGGGSCCPRWPHSLRGLFSRPRPAALPPPRPGKLPSHFSCYFASGSFLPIGPTSLFSARFFPTSHAGRESSENPLSCLSSKLKSSKGAWGSLPCAGSSFFPAFLSEHGGRPGLLASSSLCRESAPTPSALLRLPWRASLPGQQGFAIRVAVRVGAKASLRPPPHDPDGKPWARSQPPSKQPGPRSPPCQPQMSRQGS